MNLQETLRQTVSSIAANKLRSGLTMLGIVWGIASVILLVGLGRGFNEDQKTRMRSIGTDIAIIFAGRTSTQAGGYAAGRPIRLKVEDALLIKQQCPLVKTISPELRRAVAEVSAYNAANRPVRGVWPEYQRFRSLEVSEGRLMNDSDEADGRRVVLLGVEAQKQLFPGKKVIGETLSMNGSPYTVIGILKEKKQNGSYGSGPDNTQLFVPYASMARDFPPGERPGIFRGWVNNIVVEVADPSRHEEAIQQIYTALGKEHHFEPTDKDALWIWDTMAGAKLTERIFSTMTLFFGCVAVLTLALGGIGVMNIMLVSVTERTREIGVRKALGATRRDIRRQFFSEAVSLTMISGAIGFIVGFGMCIGMKYLPLPEFVPHPIVSISAILASLVTLGAISIFAGVYPASRAAVLDPIECLRYE